MPKRWSTAGLQFKKIKKFERTSLELDGAKSLGPNAGS